MSSHDPEAACRAAAAALGGEARVEPGGAATVTARLDGVEVTAALAADGAARVSCAAAAAGDLSLRLYPEGLASGLGKMFGAQDVEIGERRIDERFMIKASDEGLARLWLGDEVRRRLAAAFPDEAQGGLDLRLESEAVSIAWSAAPPDAGRLEAAIRAASGLARRPAELLAELRALADELGAALADDGASVWRSGGAVAMTAPLPGGGEAVIDHVSVALASRRPTLHTRLSATRAEGKALPGRAAICRPDAHVGAASLLGTTLFEHTVTDLDFSREYWVGVDRWALLAAGLDEAWRRATRSVGPVAATLAGDQVTVYLDGFVADPARLRRSLELVSTLAGATRAAPRPQRPPPAAARPRSFAETWNRTALAGQALAPGTDRANVEVSGAHVSVWEERTLEGRRTVAAAAADAAGLELRVTEGEVGYVLEAIGDEGVDTGDAAFDERAIVTTNDPGYARLWLGSEFTAALTRAMELRPPDDVRGYEYSIDRGRARASRLGPERDPARLEAVVRAVALLARRGRAIVSQTRALAADLGGSLLGDPTTWDPETGVPFTIGQGDAAITVSQALSTALGARPMLLTRVHQAWAAPRGDRFVICAHARLKQARRLLAGDGAKVRLARLSAGDPVFDFTFWAGGEDGEALAARLDARTCSRIVLAAPEAIVSDRQEIDLWLAGFVVDVDRLRLVTKILAALGGLDLTAGPAGPYR